MKIKLLLASVAVGFISSCASNNSSSQEPYQSFINDKIGLYQVSFEQNGQAQIAQLSVDSKSSTLTLVDDLDNKQVFRNTFDTNKNTFSFSDTQSCSASDGVFKCSIGGEPLVLSKVDLPAITSIEGLAGEYSMVADDELVIMNLASDGSFIANFTACEINGDISIESNLIRVLESTNSCVDETSMGSAFISTLVEENDTIEMLLPDSALTGYWVQ